MTPIPDRQTLESLKRAELQRLCKEHGVKANQKSEDLINQLLESQRTSSNTSIHPNQPDSQARSRGKHKRNDSAIPHQEVEEERLEEPKERKEISRDLASPTDDTGPSSETLSGPQVRPTGSKPRALTKSLISPRSRRMKVNRDKEQPALQDEGVMTVLSETEPPTGINHSHPTNGTSIGNSGSTSIDTLSAVDKHVADAIRPLHDQIEKFKLELEQLQTLKAQSSLIQSQAAEISTLRDQVKSLQTEVEELRSEVAPLPSLQLQINQLKETLEPRATVTPPNPRTPPSPGNPLPRVFQEYQDHPHLNSPKASPMSKQDITPMPRPGMARILLGKRHRDSTTSDILGNEQDASTSDIHKPERKKPKLSRGQSDNHSDHAEHVPEPRSFEEDEPGPSTQPIRRAPAFTVFNDADQPLEDDTDAPPTNHLPAFFSRSSPLQPAPDLPPTNLAHATETQQPFRFSFLAQAATPAAGLFQNSFPYPEQPASPTPIGMQSTPVPSQTQGKRTDVFQQFGLPPPGRPARFAGRSLGSGSDDHPTLGGSGKSRDPGSDNSLMKRTMYGTELDSDTRFGDFGDFGAEGSNKFWSTK